MTGRNSAEERISRWLTEEAQGELPDWVLRDAFVRTRALRQARVRPAWRFLEMTRSSMRFVAVGAAAIALIAIGLIFATGGGPGPAPSPSPSAAPSLGASSTIDPATWTPFSSTVCGFDARYPAGWSLEAGTTVATLANLTSAGTNFDHFRPTPSSLQEMYGTSTLLPAGMSEDDWVAAYRDPIVQQFGEGCFPARSAWEPVTVDGHPGGLYVGCNYVESTTFFAGRAYIFTYALLPGAQPGSETKAMLEALLSTVTLHPERAVLASPPAS